MTTESEAQLNRFDLASHGLQALGAMLEHNEEYGIAPGGRQTRTCPGYSARRQRGCGSAVRSNTGLSSARLGGPKKCVRLRATGAQNRESLLFGDWKQAGEGFLDTEGGAKL